MFDSTFNLTSGLLGLLVSRISYSFGKEHLPSQYLYQPYVVMTVRVCYKVALLLGDHNKFIIITSLKKPLLISQKVNKIQFKEKQPMKSGILPKSIFHSHVTRQNLDIFENLYQKKSSSKQIKKGEIENKDGFSIQTLNQ